MDIQTKIDSYVNSFLEGKLSFDILLVSDATSRLSELRGYNALEQFRKLYSTMATVNLTVMTSDAFVKRNVDVSEFNVIWIDNVINRQFNDALSARLDALKEVLVDGAEGDEAQANLYRSLHLRVIYALDEFVWDAPAGRQVTVLAAKTVEDAMIIADEVVVPNSEFAGALTGIKLVDEGKDVLVLPTFVNDMFYPLYRDNHKSGHYTTSIRRPKILVKGVTIPRNVQQFILDNCKDYEFTICSVGELINPLYKLLQDKTVKNIKHWAYPTVKMQNFASTMAAERDAGFDFVMTTCPDDVAQNPYEVTTTDTDSVIAVAEGAVAIAGVADADYDPSNHICVATGLVFGNNSTVKELKSLIERWRICINWDDAYDKQKALLQSRIMGTSQEIVGGFFHIMLGKTLSAAFGNRLHKEVAERKAKK